MRVIYTFLLFLGTGLIFSQNAAITGTVLDDANGAFLPGVSVKIKSLKLINNELYVFLENSYVVKFNINGEINSIIKLPQKIKSNPIFVNKNMLYIDQKNRLVILD